MTNNHRLAEKYTLNVAGKTFVVQFLPMVFFEDYTEEQLDALAQKAVYDVTFYLEDFTTADGTLVAGFGIMNTGDAFRVLGAVAHNIIKWAQEKKPDYLCWYALEPNRQKLYHRMVSYFEKRGSGLRRLDADPFTGVPCTPGMFWVGR